MEDLGLVIAIASDDRFLHVGTEEDLLAHARQHRASPGSPPPERRLELYDESGRVLAPLLDTDFDLVALVPTGALVDTETLRERMVTVLDRAREALAGGEGAHLNVGPDDVPSGSGSLSEVARAVHDELSGGGTGEHRSGWFHNLMHSLG